MPIYEYLCETCDHKFEVQQKFSDPPIETCIKCGKTVRKLISASGIMFKGSGWYVTDYSEKLKDPNQATSSKTDNEAKDKSNGAGESVTKKDSSDGGSSSTGASSNTGGSGTTKETGSSGTSPTPSSSSSPSSATKPSSF